MSRIISNNATRAAAAGPTTTSAGARLIGMCFSVTRAPEESRIARESTLSPEATAWPLTKGSAAPHSAPSSSGLSSSHNVVSRAALDAASAGARMMRAAEADASTWSMSTWTRCSLQSANAKRQPPNSRGSPSTRDRPRAVSTAPRRVCRQLKLLGRRADGAAAERATVRVLVAVRAPAVAS
eukprot:scaffold146299_cov39-Tisochrysis_lutea.AAC.6